jgi:hypothetical protein
MTPIEQAETLLEKAIALHAKHMNGTAPTTGPMGMKSQMEMMNMMKSALLLLRRNKIGGIFGR